MTFLSSWAPIGRCLLSQFVWMRCIAHSCMTWQSSSNFYIYVTNDLPKSRYIFQTLWKKILVLQCSMWRYTTQSIEKRCLLRRYVDTGQGSLGTHCLRFPMYLEETWDLRLPVHLTITLDSTCLANWPTKQSNSLLTFKCMVKSIRERPYVRVNSSRGVW